MRIGIPEAQALQLLLDNSGADIVAETRRIARQLGLRPITTPVCSPKSVCRSTMKAHSLRRLAGSAAASWELSGSTCDSHLQPLPRNLSVLAVDNAMIARLPGPDRAHLLSGAEKVPLASAQELWRPGEPVAHVYFPIRGFVCLIATDPPPSGLEIAMIGREGMLGMQAVLGSDRAPFRAVVHAEGSAWRMAMDVFQQHLSCHPATKQLLDRYVTFRLSQLATLAHCLCHHEVGPRLARWLLMSQDRAGSDRLRVTQEALGSMLGVRRVSVTTAATALQHRGVIAYHRGNLQVLDRKALEQAACGCYRSDLERYAALFNATHCG